MTLKLSSLFALACLVAAIAISLAVMFSPAVALASPVHPLRLAVVAITAPTAVDLAPIGDLLVKAATTALLMIIAWGVRLACAKLHIDNQSNMAQAVQGALDNGVTLALHGLQARIDSGGLTIDLKNQAAQQAATYVIGHFPEWSGKLGLDFDKLAETAMSKIIARLPAA